MITPKRPSGFHEFLPGDQLVFNGMIAAIRKSYESFGYTPLETPALELAAVLHAKEGGESAKQGYQFTKGDTDLALRFDLTVPLARYVAEHYHELAFPFRRYQIQDVWRAEKPQAGRYRQFYQCDIDIIGSTSVAADADILIAMHAAVTALKLKTTLRISNRKIFSAILNEKKLSARAVDVLRLIDKLDKAGAAKIKKNLIESGLKAEDAELLLDVASWRGGAAEIAAKLSALNIKQAAFTEGLNELTETCSLLAAAGLQADQYAIDLGVVRGLDYYTGMVFEIELCDRPDIGSIGGGGRYDNLVGHYSKENLSGVGGSIGLSRLFAALQGTATKAATPAQALIVVFNEKLLPYCFTVAAKLRQAGLNIAVFPGSDKAGKQMAYADKLGIPFALLCGEDEEKAKTVTIKDMKTGKQESISLKDCISLIKKS